jgi:hypothetical protein
MKLKEGTILKNEYTIESVLGSGGFGITYKVSKSIKIGNSEMVQLFAIKEHFVKKHCEREDTGRVTCSNPSLEIVNTTNERSSESKSSTFVSITSRQNSETFDISIYMFDKNPAFSKRTVKEFFFKGKFMIF